MSTVTALGIDLGGTSIKWGLVTTDGTLLAGDTVPLASRDSARVVAAIAAVVESVAARDDIDLAGVGIGAPGLIDAGRAVVRISPNFPEWNNVPLVELVRGETRYAGPMVLENDANVLVFSETRWGSAVGMKNVVVLTLGTGVGGGVMVDGRLLRGANGGAGELGHIPIDINGPPIGTRVKGNFEAYCSIGGVMREAAEVFAPDDPPADPGALTLAADEGDPRALEVWRRIGLFLGAGVAAYINIFNPEAVLVGGGISGAGDHLMEPARLTARSRSFAPNWNDCTFARASLEHKAGLFGAAAMAFDDAGVDTTARR